MKHRIVVLGAGYAGAIAAGRLAKRLHRDDTEITVVNADARLRRAGPHAPARHRAGPRAPPAERDLRRHRRRRCGWRGSPPSTPTAGPSRSPTTHGTDEIAYDTLVYALGSAAADHGVPGVAEHAYDIAGRPSALRLRDRLGQPRRRRDRARRRRRPHRPRGGHRDRRGPAGPRRRARRPRRPRRLALRRRRSSTCGRSVDRLGITVHEHTDIARVEADRVRSPPTAG